MLDRVVNAMLEKPRRLLELGRVLVRAGGFLLIMDLVGSVVSTGALVEKSMGTSARPDVALSALLPPVLTSWISEDFFGFAFAALLVAAGLAALRKGRIYQRLLRC